MSSAAANYGAVSTMAQHSASSAHTTATARRNGAGETSTFSTSTKEDATTSRITLDETMPFSKSSIVVRTTSTSNMNDETTMLPSSTIAYMTYTGDSEATTSPPDVNSHQRTTSSAGPSIEKADVSITPTVEPATVSANTEALPSINVTNGNQARPSTQAISDTMISYSTLNGTDFIGKISILYFFKILWQ